MGIKTDIEYVDSSCNIIMGCDGCELWSKKLGIFDCYAGKTVSRYMGLNGWPDRFEQPKLFLDRLSSALGWSDLTGKERESKPWLNGMPRIIFLNDMSDSFTKSISPHDWLSPNREKMEQSKHILLFLTKRPSAMWDYFDKTGPAGRNFWLGTTVTSQNTMKRLEILSGIEASVRWCSFEPLLSRVTVRKELLSRLDWAVVGGGSYMERKTQPPWVDDLISQLDDAGIPTFFKQWGSIEVNPDIDDPTAQENGGRAKGGRTYRGVLRSEMPYHDWCEAEPEKCTDCIDPEDKTLNFIDSMEWHPDANDQ